MNYKFYFILWLAIVVFGICIMEIAGFYQMGVVIFIAVAGTGVGIAHYLLTHHVASPFFRLYNGFLLKRSRALFAIASTPSKELVENLKRDLLFQAIPTSLSFIKSGEQIVLETHLLPQDESNRKAVISFLGADCVLIEKSWLIQIRAWRYQLIAYIYWQVKKRRGICDPAPKVLNKKWYRLSITKQ
ncbi:MAG: hypothetical protein ACOX8N_10205 [Christensenellales bacterium]